MSKHREALFFHGLKRKEATVRARKGHDMDAADLIYEDLFLHQRSVVDDPYRRKAALCPRRAGKSWCGLAYAFITALRNPGSTVTIISLTLKAGKRNFWPLVAEFDELYALGLKEGPGKMHNTNLEITLPNGSFIFLSGADTRDKIERLRGNKYHLAVIDECKSFWPSILRELIQDVIGPGTNDVSGSMLLIGTPGNILSGPFFEATYPGATRVVQKKEVPYTRMYLNHDPEKWKDLTPQWSGHTWTVRDNTAKPQIWENALETMAIEGWSPDNPKWRREYLGEWVAAVDSLVYSFGHLMHQERGEHSCVWERGIDHSRVDDPYHKRWGLPAGYTDWRFVAGIDLGFIDDFAIVIAAWSPQLRKLFYVEGIKAPGLDIERAAHLIYNTLDAFDGKVEAIVGDTGALGKMIIESLNNMYGLYIQAAEKRAKFDHIELFNSDLYNGFIQIDPASDLAYEMLHLHWRMEDGDDKKILARTGRLHEDPNCDNHLCDAALYLWRFAQHHFVKPQDRLPEKGSREWYEYLDQLDAEQAVTERNRPSREWWQDLHQRDKKWTNLLN